MSTRPTRLPFLLSASLLAGLTACATTEPPADDTEVARRKVTVQPVDTGALVVRDEESTRYDLDQETEREGRRRQMLQEAARQAAEHDPAARARFEQATRQAAEDEGPPPKGRPRRLSGVRDEPRAPAPSTPFVATAEDRVSTFGMDVDTASWDFTRARLLVHDRPPAPSAVRTEELVNALRAEYALPTGGDALRVQLDAAPSPFGPPGHLLLRVGVQARHVSRAERRDASLVLVVDTSRSMAAHEKLEAVKGALTALVTRTLRPTDEVAIVAFESTARVVLAPTPVAEAHAILAAIAGLTPGGYTSVQAGLELAYGNAAAWFRWPADATGPRPDRLCRVILCTDGIANTGLTDAPALLRRIRDHVKQGVQLTAVGVGISGEGDALLEQLADAGDGQYVYVDGPGAATRAFVEQATGTLQLVARDAKVQVELDPRSVARWRLLGYEDRGLADRDFRDDQKDAGDVGAGHSVTAFYELEPAAGAPAAAPLATARIRWQDPDRAVATERAATLAPGDVAAWVEALPPRFLLQAVAAELAELLRGIPHVAADPWPPLRARATEAAERLAGDPQAAELAALVERAHALLARSK